MNFMSAEVVIVKPDAVQAMAALNAAAELLTSANERLNTDDFGNSFEDSRGSIRVAVSALMFRDGVIAQTLESAVAYLTEKYPDSFPLEKWEEIEKTVTGEGPGLMNAIIGIMGKKTRKEEAEDAMKVAIEFLDTVKTMV